jgi:hypothetical protein
VPFRFLVLALASFAAAPSAVRAASMPPAAEASPDSAAPAATAAPPPALRDAEAFDTPNDGGRSITILWDAAPEASVDDRVIVERVASNGEAVEVARVPLSEVTFLDAPTSQGAEGPPDGSAFTYRLTAVSAADTTLRSAPFVTAPASARPQFFNRERINVLLLLGTFFVFVLVNVQRAARGGKIHVRKLQPVIAIEEAIGRATEMGRPVLYVPGIEEVDDIQTVASMGILGKVAEMTARYDVALRVPTARPFVMAVADEVVRAGCMQAGRPDAYQPDRIQFISTEQFAYCAGVNGIILREKPAANLYLGKFFAESLIFAETGFAAGSIQIAGTAEVTQLPFFIAACDYTLIGEEFFAAGAYLTQDSALLSTLAAADWAKLLLVLLLVAGTIFQSAGMPEFAAWFVVR